MQSKWGLSMLRTLLRLHHGGVSAREIGRRLGVALRALLCRLGRRAEGGFMRAFAGEGARRQGDLFQGDGGGKQNAPLAQIIDHRGHDDVAAIRSGRLVERDMNEGALVVASAR
jgi:hypothetical protein